MMVNGEAGRRTSEVQRLFTVDVAYAWAQTGRFDSRLLLLQNSSGTPFPMLQLNCPRSGNRRYVFGDSFTNSSSATPILVVH
jgi:hypothetical protein